MPFQFLSLISLLALCIGAVPSCGGGGDEAAEQNASSPLQRSTVTVKIMPLGDSITQSSKGLNSYRYYLWHLLIDAGYRPDFVGSRVGVGGGPPANADFDMDHEGHAGWRADEMLAQTQTLTRAASPDFVLLHIGTNDLSQGRSVDSTVTDIAGIIDALRAVNPRMRILMAQIIGKTGTPSVATLNARLPALVADKQEVESPIVLVDEFTGFDPATMTYDGTHPNAVGDSRMADRWFEQLAPALDAFLAGGP